MEKFEYCIIQHHQVIKINGENGTRLQYIQHFLRKCGLKNT